jgi:hypothetical protein
MLRLFRASGITCADDALEGIVAVLSRYPREVIDAVTSPDGLYSSCKWFPTGKEVTDACEAAMAPVRRRLEAERAVAATLRARGEANAAEESRPTRENYDELQARHGRNWGIGGDKGVSVPWPAWALDMNRRFFERECIAAGLDHETTKVSPTLARMMAERKD